MLLIGFSWVLAGFIAALIVQSFVGGPWEDSGPTVILPTCLGAFTGSAVVILYQMYPDITGTMCTESVNVGLVGSAVGAVMGFGGYVVAHKKPLPFPT